MKKIFILLLTIILLIFCTGCAEAISEDRIEVEATVTSIYHKEAWLQPIYNGKSFTYVPHPARWEVTFTYKEYSVTIDDKTVYDLYKEGDLVICVLITTYYDNGTSETKLKYEGVK